MRATKIWVVFFFVVSLAKLNLFENNFCRIFLPEIFSLISFPIREQKDMLLLYPMLK